MRKLRKAEEKFLNFFASRVRRLKDGELESPILVPRDYPKNTKVSTLENLYELDLIEPLVTFYTSPIRLTAKGLQILKDKESHDNTQCNAVDDV